MNVMPQVLRPDLYLISSRSGNAGAVMVRPGIRALQPAHPLRRQTAIVAELYRFSDIEDLTESNFDFIMVKAFKVGEHVSWNSEAGRVRGKIIRVHRRDLNYKGYTHHASPDEPLYEIKSDKTDHVALHKAQALRRLGRPKSSS